MRLFHIALTLAAKPVIGGQAVIEGVMMRSPKSLAIAVRQPDGTIAVREERWLSFAERFGFLKWPGFRGANMLVESLYNGMLALNWSATTAFPDDAKAKEANAKGGSGLWITVGISLVFAFALFKGLPHLSAWGLGELIGNARVSSGGDGSTALPMSGALFHLVDGAIKIAIFAGYITLISRLDDVKRLFMYHGAEHKSVHVWEANEPLDVAHATTKSTAHPRCGTSLILLVIAVSVLVFALVLPFVQPVVASFVPNEFAQALVLLVLKIPLMLPIAGLAYEAQRLAAKHPGNLLVRALISPGMLMQKLTTREPGAPELEVALAALRKTVWREQQPEGGPSGEVVPLRGASTVEVFSDFEAVKRVA
jgi:uncharacterized protein YqhQ